MTDELAAQHAEEVLLGELCTPDVRIRAEQFLNRWSWRKDKREEARRELLALIGHALVGQADDALS